MYRRGDKEFILDMFIAVQNILDYTDAMSFEEFLRDNKTVDAVLRNIEILGEAVKHISNEFREKYPQIEWSAIAKTRDKIIHSYFGVDLDTVWKIIVKDIPRLKQSLAEIIKTEGWRNEI
jgi:uncharacterized protein with HEPN domain